MLLGRGKVMKNLFIFIPHINEFSNWEKSFLFSPKFSCVCWFDEKIWENNTLKLKNNNKFKLTKNPIICTNTHTSDYTMRCWATCVYSLFASIPPIYLTFIAFHTQGSLSEVETIEYFVVGRYLFFWKLRKTLIEIQSRYRNFLFMSSLWNWFRIVRWVGG